MSVTLNSKISEVSGIGPSSQKKLEKLGIKTAKDLLLYFPRRWDDYSKITPIAEIKIGEQVSVRGIVFDIGTKRTRTGKPVTEVIITDKTGSVKAVWFNNRFIEKSLAKGEEIFMAGKLEWSYGQVSMNAPVWEKVQTEQNSEYRHVGRIVPIYPETDGVNSKWFRNKISPLTKLVYSIKDHLPEVIKKEYELMELPAAIRSMHFPENITELERAKYRLKFDNLFCLFCSVLSNRKANEVNRAVVVDFDESVGKKFVESLPFQMTDAQRKASWEILKDLTRPIPMNRLLEGDVGSGKTVVAAMAALMVANKGYQSALLVPTEILATQHYESLRQLLAGFNVTMELLTGSTTTQERNRILKSLSSGDTNFIIGTHALLSEGVNFWTLALVIVDEQHRFGVGQRMKLKEANGEAGTMPHFLSMSATPIPRTLAISVFGDLDISLLDELPPGRKKVQTHLVPPEKRVDGYKFIEKKIDEGRQVFVVCPLVNESDKLGVRSATSEAKRLSDDIFPHKRVGLLHGKMKSEEKEKVMSEFKTGEIDILVSTSVIEVGVDVPNATVMFVEGAERFGLAQLHQFRGRVGRGGHQSFCFLFTDNWNEDTKKRLETLVQLNNGFELAEKDLELRGPGELLGVKQHGKIDETLRAVISDPSFISKVKNAASIFLAKSDIAKYPNLVEKVAEFDTAAKLE